MPVYTSSCQKSREANGMHVGQIYQMMTCLLWVRCPSVFGDEMLPAGTHVNQNINWVGFAPAKALVIGVSLIHPEFVSFIQNSSGALLVCIGVPKVRT